MKRVLSVIHAPRWGGIHTIMERVGPLCGEAGWEWIVLLPRTRGENGRARLEKAGLKVVDIPLRRIRKTLNPLVQLGFVLSIPLDIWRLTRVIRDEKIDVVQVCGLMHFHSAVAGRLMGKPVVWQMHSDQPPGFLKRFFTPWVVRIADVAMTAGRKIIPKHPGLSAMGDRLFVFFAPVNMQRYRPDAERRIASRKAMGVGPGDIVVGTAGGRGPNKNHAMLVEVADQLRASHPNLKYAILGQWLPQHRAYYEAEVIKPAEDRGLVAEGVVQFVDPGSDVDFYLTGFDIFALPSHGEGISVVTGEAMATRLPVVVNDVGSMSDFVTDGEVGRLNRSRTAEEMAGHIAELADDPALRDQFGEAALAYARLHLDERVCADIHIQAYAAAERRRVGG